MKQHVKKNNTFNILICCPFCQEVISYLQMETEKESIPFRANKVKQFSQALAKREVFALNKQKGKPEEW